MTAKTLPVSVIVPTIGRPRLLADCLGSIAACVPGPAEIVVVDQSGSPEVAAVVSRFSDAGARLVRCEGTGKAKGANLGLRVATEDVVLFTDDDCTVDPRWVVVGASLMEEDPSAIVTGKVLPVGDPQAVPSTIADEEARDYQGEVRSDVLFWGNMAAGRAALLAAGGFDERIVPNAADNDLCFRWLSGGRRLRYRPELVVFHHDWRSESELERLYVNYAIGQGMFYAKHLRQRDFRILRFLARDAYYGLHAEYAHVRRRRPRSADWSFGVFPGLPRGLVRGWKAFGAPSTDSAGAPR